jgi:hypothetical protein
MLVKPKTALTGVPSGLVIGGRAWKARKMKPDPSMRIRCGGTGFGSVTGIAGSVVGAVAGAFVEHVVAGAIWAGDLVVLDAQEYPWVAEAAVSAVARYGAVVDVNGLGWDGGAVWHGTSLKAGVSYGGFCVTCGA